MQTGQQRKQAAGLWGKCYAKNKAELDHGEWQGQTGLGQDERLISAISMECWRNEGSEPRRHEEERIPGNKDGVHKDPNARACGLGE